MCSATSRVLVHKSIRDAVLSKVVERLAAIKIGNSLSEHMMAETGPTMGPVINKTQYTKIWVSR